MYKIAVTNRYLCENFEDRLKALATEDWQYIVLREKDLQEEEYLSLAKKALEYCGDRLVLHSFTAVAEKIGCDKIHLTMASLRTLKNRENFSLVGVSAHTVEELREAEHLGADYATFSPVFATECKRGVEPKGLDELKRACDSVNIPVYALGGIDATNAESCIKAGAAGVCEMSAAMN
jgi:thiamine-phosphate pyrophosphorylase